MTSTAGAEALRRTRRADSDRRRQQVKAALEQLTATGAEPSIASVARTAKVSRAFVYRHGDLHALILQCITGSAPTEAAAVAGTAVSHASLLAEVANQRERNLRLARHIAKLEGRLSELLGEQVFRASGLGAPDNIEQLHRRITTLEQDNALLREEVASLGDDLSAARAVNRELLAEINRASRPAGSHAAGTPRGETAEPPQHDGGVE
jgi:cell division protein FtsB